MPGELMSCELMVELQVSFFSRNSTVKSYEAKKTSKNSLKNGSIERKKPWPSLASCLVSLPQVEAFQLCGQHQQSHCDIWMFSFITSTNIPSQRADGLTSKAVY